MKGGVPLSTIIVLATSKGRDASASLSSLRSDYHYARTITADGEAKRGELQHTFRPLGQSVQGLSQHTSGFGRDMFRRESRLLWQHQV